jgi:hypothetical protein
VCSHTPTRLPFQLRGSDVTSGWSCTLLESAPTRWWPANRLPPEPEMAQPNGLYLPRVQPVNVVAVVPVYVKHSFPMYAVPELGKFAVEATVIVVSLRSTVAVICVAEPASLRCISLPSVSSRVWSSTRIVQRPDVVNAESRSMDCSFWMLTNSPLRT